MDIGQCDYLIGSICRGRSEDAPKISSRQDLLDRASESICQIENESILIDLRRALDVLVARSSGLSDDSKLREVVFAESDHINN